MSDNPVPRAAALLEGAYARSLELAGDDLLSPWAMLATRTALVSSLLNPTANTVAPLSSGSITDDLQEALRLLTGPGARAELRIDDLVTARRWLSDVVAEAAETSA